MLAWHASMSRSLCSAQVCETHLVDDLSLLEWVQ